MKERLQKIIASAGVCSRRRAEELICAGLVTVNGSTAALGDLADVHEDAITVDGKPLVAQEERVTLLLYKPRGYLSAVSDDRGRKTVTELVPAAPRLFPVGRLDLNSEGLLLMTNDGALANRLLHPSHEIEKVYHVWVQDYKAGAAALLRRPIVLDGRPISTPKVRLLHTDSDGAMLAVTIHEGRNRQIRRMCEAAGLRVTRLKRVREGPMVLGPLRPGEYRTLTEEEIKRLMTDHT